MISNWHRFVKSSLLVFGISSSWLWTSISAQLDCAPSAMSKCTDPLKEVTDNKDLGFATSKEELVKMCPKLMDGLRCIDDFTLRCLDREHRAYFNTFIYSHLKATVNGLQNDLIVTSIPGGVQ